MNEKNQNKRVEERIYDYEDEIELMDILLVIWKRKYLIIGGAIVCTLIAIIFSYAAPNIYRASMMLEPGIKKIDQNGKKIYIDSPANIKALIESSILDNQILNYIKNSGDSNTSNALSFNVSIPTGLNVLNISYDTPIAGEGIDKLKFLHKALNDKYSDLLKFFRNDIDRKIHTKNGELTNSKITETRIKIKYEKDIQSKTDHVNDLRLEEIRIKDNINDIRKILFELESRVKRAIDSNESLIEQRNRLTKDSNKDALVFDSLSLNTIQQNLILENSCRNQIISYSSQKTEAENNLIKVQKKLASLLRVLEELEKGKNDIQTIPIFQPELYKTQKQIENVKRKIEELRKEKQNIQNNKILQPPIATQLPIKRINTKRNALLAATIGSFLMVFLAFFLSYINNYKKRVQHEKGSLVSKKDEMERY